jgi:hypothetical protein
VPVTTGFSGGSLARGIGVVVGAAGIQILAGLVVNKLITQPSFERQMENLEPLIQAQVQGKRDELMALYASDPSLVRYAHVTIRVRNTTTLAGGVGQSDVSQTAHESVIPTVTLKKVDVGPDNKRSKEYFFDAHLGGVVETGNDITYSRRLQAPPFEDLVEYAKAKRLPLERLKAHARVMLDRSQQISHAQIAVDQMKYWQNMLDQLNGR